jgi:uncharacterized protein YsxB (DUF464 family)
MIKVVIQRAPEGKIESFQVRGHAGFADAGDDIVCAAASILIQNAVNSIETLLHVKIPDKSGSGYVECQIPSLEEHVSEQTQLLLESMAYGLRVLADEYPKHVIVKDKQL